MGPTGGILSGYQNWHMIVVVSGKLIDQWEEEEWEGRRCSPRGTDEQTKFLYESLKKTSLQLVLIRFLGTCNVRVVFSLIHFYKFIRSCPLYSTSVHHMLVLHVSNARLKLNMNPVSKPAVPGSSKWGIRTGSGPVDSSSDSGVIRSRPQHRCCWAGPKGQNKNKKSGPVS